MRDDGIGLIGSRWVLSDLNKLIYANFWIDAVPTHVIGDLG
jgi:hypothetical protein